MSDPVAALSGVSALSSLKLSTFIAGVVGSTISLRFLGRKLTPWEVITTVPCGAALAVYGAPMIANYEKIIDEQIVIGLGFFIGLFGLSLCAAIYDAIRNGTLTRVVSSRLGAPPQPPEGQ